jgi:hypothetical protein
MKKQILYTLCLLSVVTCYGQTTAQQPSNFDFSKLELGGNFGLSFGNDASSVIIAPQIGYVFTPKLSAGVGVNYSYYRYSPNPHNRISLNYMGFNAYGRVKPANPIVLQIQPEIFRTWGSSYGTSISQFVATLLVGGGVVIPTGNNGGISLMLYYDLVQNNYSPYRDGLYYSVGYAVRL